MAAGDRPVAPTLCRQQFASAGVGDTFPVPWPTLTFTTGSGPINPIHAWDVQTEEDLIASGALEYDADNNRLVARAAVDDPFVMFRFTPRSRLYREFSDGVSVSAGRFNEAFTAFLYIAQEGDGGTDDGSGSGGLSDEQIGLKAFRHAPAGLTGEQRRAVTLATDIGLRWRGEWRQGRIYDTGDLITSDLGATSGFYYCLSNHRASTASQPGTSGASVAATWTALGLSEGALDSVVSADIQGDNLVLTRRNGVQTTLALPAGGGGGSSEQRVLRDVPPSASTVGDIILRGNGEGLTLTQAITHPQTLPQVTAQDFPISGNYLGVFDDGTPPPESYAVGNWFVNGLSYQPEVIVLRANRKTWVSTSYSTVAGLSGGAAYRGVFRDDDAASLHVGAVGDLYVSVRANRLRRVTAFTPGSRGAESQYHAKHVAMEDAVTAKFGGLPNQVRKLETEAEKLSASQILLGNYTYNTSFGIVKGQLHVGEASGVLRLSVALMDDDELEAKYLEPGVFITYRGDLRWQVMRLISNNPPTITFEVRDLGNDPAAVNALANTANPLVFMRGIEERALTLENRTDVVEGQHFDPTAENFAKVIKAGDNISVVADNDAQTLTINGRAGGGSGAAPTAANTYPIVKGILVPGTNTTLTETDGARTIAVNVANKTIDDRMETFGGVSWLFSDGTTEQISRIHPTTATRLFGTTSGVGITPTARRTDVRFLLTGFIAGFNALAQLTGVFLNGVRVRTNGAALEKGEYIGGDVLNTDGAVGHFALICTLTNQQADNVITNGASSGEARFEVRYSIGGQTGLWSLNIDWLTTAEAAAAPVTPHIPIDAVKDGINADEVAFAPGTATRSGTNFTYPLRLNLNSPATKAATTNITIPRPSDDDILDAAQGTRGTLDRGKILATASNDENNLVLVDAPTGGQATPSLPAPQTVNVGSLGTFTVAPGASRALPVTGISTGAYVSKTSGSNNSLTVARASTLRVYASVTVRASGSGNGRLKPVLTPTGAGVRILSQSSPYIRTTDTSTDYAITLSADFAVTGSNTVVGLSIGNRAGFSIQTLSLQVVAYVGIAPFIGQRGDQGPAGARGPEGPAGSRGPAGAAGAAGARGPAGDAGPAGPAGPQGPAGAQGPAGPQGPAGSGGGGSVTDDGILDVAQTSRSAADRGKFLAVSSRDQNDLVLASAPSGSAGVQSLSTTLTGITSRGTNALTGVNQITTDTTAGTTTLRLTANDTRIATNLLTPGATVEVTFRAYVLTSEILPVVNEAQDYEEYTFPSTFGGIVASTTVGSAIAGNIIITRLFPRIPQFPSLIFDPNARAVSSEAILDQAKEGRGSSDRGKYLGTSATNENELTLLDAPAGGGSVTDDAVLDLAEATRTSSDRGKFLGVSTTNENELALLNAPAGGGSVTDDAVLDLAKPTRTSSDRNMLLGTSATNENELALFAMPSGGGGGSSWTRITLQNTAARAVIPINNVEPNEVLVIFSSFRVTTLVVRAADLGAGIRVGSGSAVASNISYSSSAKRLTVTNGTSNSAQIIIYRTPFTVG